ncbi:hypothetical protein KIN20_028032 [Parelaphostrongylus tenuis]|uniref:Uncharacterized protein n=1 Tax=Parelaphostrongylus tenuis TaxID=148309 RepID=A0AAD5R0K1_PARTN|nr:hypothetical protein KIN20_028032 [Parelaphostrongylus tenuis]
MTGEHGVLCSPSIRCGCRRESVAGIEVRAEREISVRACKEAKTNTDRPPGKTPMAGSTIAQFYKRMGGAELVELGNKTAVLQKPYLSIWLDFCRRKSALRSTKTTSLSRSRLRRY